MKHSKCAEVSSIAEMRCRTTTSCAFRSQTLQRCAAVSVQEGGMGWACGMRKGGKQASYREGRLPVRVPYTQRIADGSALPALVLALHPRGGCNNAGERTHVARSCSTARGLMGVGERPSPFSILASILECVDGACGGLERTNEPGVFVRYASQVEVGVERRVQTAMGCWVNRRIGV